MKKTVALCFFVWYNKLYNREKEIKWTSQILKTSSFQVKLIS